MLRATGRPIQTRFRFCSLNASPRYTQQLAGSLCKRHAVGRDVPKDDIALPLLVDIRFQVLFHSPQRGAFHLSLTVLVHYRSHVGIEPWKMVLPDSHRISRVPWYLGNRQGSQRRLRLQDYYLLWSNFPERSADRLICNSPAPS
jgi:hypothetical protein